MAHHCLGLDLGQTTDYSALVALQLGGGQRPHAVRHLQRFPLGTPYTKVVTHVGELLKSGPLRGSPLVVDQTGVGRPVVDLFRAATAALVVPVTITAGGAVSLEDDGSLHVPKRELVGALRGVLEDRRLVVARGLGEAAALARELQAFRVRITEAAHETFGAARPGDHDDLVLALALACWFAERFGGEVPP